MAASIVHLHILRKISVRKYNFGVSSRFHVIFTEVHRGLCTGLLRSKQEVDYDKREDLEVGKRALMIIFNSFLFKWNLHARVGHQDCEADVNCRIVEINFFNFFSFTMRFLFAHAKNLRKIIAETRIKV